MNGGVFSVSRDIFDHPIVGRDPARLKAWLQMVAKACWKPTKFDVKGKTVTIDRGQFATTYRQLSDDLGWSLGATQRFLTRLKTDTMIETATDTGKMVITICNYEIYQLSPIETDTATDTPTDTKLIQNRYTKEEGKEGKEEKKEGSKTRGARITASSFPSFISPEKAQDYLDFRRAKRAPVTSGVMKALTQALTELHTEGIDPDGALVLAMSRNWQGFRAEWVRNEAKRNNGDDRHTRKIEMATRQDRRGEADSGVDHDASGIDPVALLPAEHIGRG